MALQASYYAGKSYYPVDMMQRENDWISPGVLSTLDLVTTQTGTPSMAVTVTGSAQGQTGGNAWLPKGYRVYNDAVATIAVSAADSTNPRIDLLVACVDTTTNPYTPSIKVIKGTAAASPVVPGITAGLVALVLCKIAVATGATTIVNANLTDLRVVTSLVGVASEVDLAIHQEDTANPHSTTASQVGLGSVNNTSDAGKPVSSAQLTALNLKANLVSPTFTSVPKAPTAAVGTNTTQLASTAFVAAALAALVNSSPSTLDTLNELAAAIGDDPNYAATISALIGTKETPEGAQAKANIVQGNLTTHLADVAYQVAGGTATALTLTTATLADGYTKTFIASATSTSTAKTINGKPFYKPGTVLSPSLTINKAYTVWYNLVGDCFFIKASAEGTALVADVLAGRTFSNDVDTGLSGGMPNKVGSATVITPTGADQAIPKGYYGGITADGKVRALTVEAGDNPIFRDDILIDGYTLTVLTKEREYLIDTGGILRIKFNLRTGHAGQDVSGRIYINGGAVGTVWINSLITSVTYTEDIPVNSGDLIQLYLKSPSSVRVFNDFIEFDTIINYPTITKKM